MSVQAWVDRGLKIREDIKRLQAELKEIEAKLENAALTGQHVELKDSDREGRRYMARGSSLVVPVVFTADRLIQSFKLNSPVHTRVRTIAGDLFKEFWSLTQVYETRFDDGKKFREEADKVLGPRAPAFITACLARDKHGTPKSDTKILWDDAADKESAT